ncbi:anti-sigma regulatory factor (Ser/Thr protein kinase) [Spinactinospora alkalitolerans]|uniref:Anti-sigma regulatory factor (Ser/Thr protein kinase) n=1 Tax=Spinactinospora alkalitolerans TaxID=687207 RepID=A0A852TX84_9ACTN|nr:ATP-binding protein [Spinactinospora alkalitolerans]NYE46470.1 anti-sigma regulatory factor (Ser/Thr protein kinase) [Spinactinospora alkalitolerans]
MTGPGPGHVRMVRYVAMPTAVGCARREALQCLKEWGLVDLLESAELMVSELVTNAVNATGPTGTRTPRYSELTNLGTVMLELRVDGEVLRLSVWDSDTRPPVLKDVGPEAEEGRGIYLIDVVSARWGHYLPPTGGKVVWCELPLEPTAGQHG